MATIAHSLLNKKLWIFYFLFVAGISFVGIAFMGKETYDAAPPVCSFVSTAGGIVVPKSDIEEGQQVFLQRGFMTLGGFMGDGAERGPEFTADALHHMTLFMREFYESKLPQRGLDSQETSDIIAVRIKRELHTNGWKETSDQDCTITINEAQAYGAKMLKKHYDRMLNDASYSEYIRLGHSLSASDNEKLASFFFWGAWVASANRPGEDYSYTHNWPYDPVAGNLPTSPVFLWSIISIFVLFIGISIVLYVYGQIRAIKGEPFNTNGKLLTTVDLEAECVRPTQRDTFPFFVLAVIAFGLQVLAGIICANDFVRPFGLFLGDYIPFSVARSYHTIFQIFWFFMCWVGYTIFFLPRLSKVPSGQTFLIRLLLFMCVTVAAGTLFGIYVGQTGILKGDMAYWFGSQGWEFMEMGRFFQIILLCAFVLWIFIIFRGVRPWLSLKNMWSVPAWLLYGSGVMVFFLFFGLMVQPRSNFAIANYWRWMVVHMWVEVTFEVFTTVIVAYMMVQMDFIQRDMAENTIFLAVMLFVLTATVGVAHNFYWIAKPTSIIALGSTFSTTQVLPLLLLTLDAWRMRRDAGAAVGAARRGTQKYVMNEIWLYLVAVNFWNIFGAGVFGSLINLPIVNYFEHGTYLTNNHAHGAMFGVKGNIALGGMLYCCQHLFTTKYWSPRLVRISFWSLNIGVALMMFLDLFPVGVYQLNACLEKGFWYARSHEIVQGTVFKTLTYFRSVGGMLFVFGGLLPLIYFVIGGATSLREENVIPAKDWPTYEKEWADQKKA